MRDCMDSLTNPDRLYTRAEVVSRTNPVPSVSGVYAWFFREPPGICPTNGCVTKNELTLLYVGISPRKRNSKQDIRKRIKTHYRGIAEGSTLRLTLGILLERKSGFSLDRTESGKSLTFTQDGERWLNDWMQRNAFVCWVEHSDPSDVERRILQTVSLPLNIQDNQDHPFCSELKNLRKEARQRLEIV